MYVLFPTPFYCTQCSETSSNILSVRFYQALKKKSLPPAQLKCRNQSILVFRKFKPFSQHLEVLIKLQNTSEHDGKATFNLFVLVTSTSLEFAYVFKFPNDHKLTGLSSVKVFSLMSQIIYHLQLIDMVAWLKINRYCIYFYILIFNFRTFLISQQRKQVSQNTIKHQWH